MNIPLRACSVSRCSPLSAILSIFLCIISVTFPISFLRILVLSLFCREEGSTDEECSLDLDLGLIRSDGILQFMSHLRGKVNRQTFSCKDLSWLSFWWGWLQRKLCLSTRWEGFSPDKVLVISFILSMWSASGDLHYHPKLGINQSDGYR